MKKLLLFSGLAAVILFSSSCRKGCTDPSADNYDPDAKKDCCCAYSPDDLKSAFQIQFIPEVNGAPFQLGQNYTSSTGHQYKFSNIKFYISNITLHADNGTREVMDTVLLFSPENIVIPLDSISSGKYNKLSFEINVDTVINKTKQPADFPFGHPLAESDMYWSWNTGYIFIKYEGSVDTSVVPDGTLDDVLLFHIGLNELARKVELNYTIDVPATESKVYTAKVKADLGNYLEGIDIRTDNNTQTMDNKPLATSFANNADKVFSIIP